MRTLAPLVTIFALLAGSLSKLSCAIAEQVKPPIRIGIIAPTSGGVAIWGQSVTKAIEVANAEMPTPLEIHVEDEETCVPTKALTAYNTLVTIKKVDVVIASCLGGAQAIAPIAQKQGIPLIISGRTSREFQDKNPNALSWLAVLNDEGEAIAELIAERGFKRGVAMIWSEYFGVQFALGIQEAISRRNMDFDFSSHEVENGSIPVGADVQRLIRSKPDVVFLMMSEPGAAFVVRQLKTLNYKGTIILQSSMLQTYDPKVREPFEGAIQQKFNINEKELWQIREKIEQVQGQDIADDFVFSYDGFKSLYRELIACRSERSIPLTKCLDSRLRDEAWREGASGKFRFMKDGTTQRPMIFKTITRTGFKPLADS